MKRNHEIVIARSRFFRVSIALALVLSPLLIARPDLARATAGAADPGDTSEVYTLTLPDDQVPPAPTGPITPARPASPLGQQLGSEVEPNNVYTQATTIASGTTIRGNIYPNADVDYYSFTARAGDRVYAATMTSFSANANNDSQLTLFASDGTSVIEFDDDDGSLGSLSSVIAGATIPAPGTYYLKVNHFNATNQLRPYELHFRLQSGAPTAEAEGNDIPATANPLSASGWMTGTRNPPLAAEQDWYSFTANAGDTVFLSLDLDPERDNVQWNGRLGIALFGDAGNQILVVDDSSAGSVSNPPAEALFMTVKNSGIYYAFVDSATAAVGGPSATYNLSVDVLPAYDEGVNCTTYTSTDVPKTIGPATGLINSTITIPGHPRIADIDATIVLTHALMGDLDVHLRSPADNDNGLFTDIGAAAVGGQTQMDTTFDDEAGIPPAYTVLKGLTFKPELAYRLAWFDGEDAGGTWTLDLRDDTANTSGGTLIGWSLRVCEPPPLPTCPSGYNFTTVFSTDFETGAAGFTHSGTQDEWALGLPTAAPITTCNSGASCWKTDLTGTYNASSSQDLLSPNINLVTVTAPIVVSWAQRYQMENATFDHAYVDAQQAGGATPTRLWEWLDATMTNVVVTTTINESSGWALRTARADSLAGLNSELRFHLDSDTTVQLGGLAIDDVSVQGCVAIPNQAPIANAGTDQNVIAGASVQLDGSASSDPDNNLALTYSWIQSGGPAVTLSSASTVSPTFTAPGTSTVLTFSLTVTDSLGLASPSDTLVVTVTNQAPIANAGTDQNVISGASVQLDGSASSDPDNHLPLTYGWTQSGGPAVTLSSASTVSPTFTAPGAPTVLTFSLTVTDSLGLASVSDTVVITTTGVPGYASSPDSGSVITVGTAYVGTVVTTTLTISNTGTATLDVTSHGVGGPDAADFSVLPDTLSIAAGSAAQHLNIQCSPNLPGLRTATLTVKHNAVGSPATYTLTCLGRVAVYLPIIMR